MSTQREHPQPLLKLSSTSPQNGSNFLYTRMSIEGPNIPLFILPRLTRGFSFTLSWIKTPHRWYCAPLFEECLQHHGHKGDPRVTLRTCGAIGETQGTYSGFHTWKNTKTPPCVLVFSSEHREISKSQGIMRLTWKT